MKFSIILNEGKKENLISKYGEEPIFKDNDFISTIVDSDPSSTKKYSEWTIKQVIDFMKVNDGASLPDVVIQITDLIKNFHDLSLTITDEDIDFAKKLHSSINDTYIKGAPKDIYRYKSYWELQTVLSAMEKKKKDREQEKEVLKDVDKLYEDSRFLVVRPYSHNASCYYGSNTKWCTASKNNRGYFNRYVDSGILIYVIDKKSNDNTLGKMAININENGNIWIYDQKDNQRSEDFLLDRFEPISGVLKKILKGDTDYEKLIRIREGKIRASQQRLTAPYFEDMNENDIFLRFDDVREYLSLMNEALEDYEIDAYANGIELPYGMDNYYYDSYNFDDDLKEGYPLYRLNSDHLKILKDILTIISPEKLKGLFKVSPNVSREKLIKFKSMDSETQDYFDLYNLSIVDHNNSLSEIGKFLSGFDDKFIEDFGYAYSIAEDESMKKGVKDVLEDELCNFYQPIGIELVGNECFYKYSISVDKVIDMYESNIEYTKDLSLKELLEWFAEENLSWGLDEPHNMAYENADEETFNYHFNSDMESALESLLEKIESDETYEDIEEYNKIVKLISNKYGFDKKVDIPTTDGTQITIQKVNPLNNKVEFMLNKKGDWRGKKGIAKLSTIEKMMTNYQLFDPFED